MANPTVRPLHSIYKPRFVSQSATELAALAGMGDPNDGCSLPGRDTPPPTCAFFCSPSSLQNPFDPNEDNLTDHAGFMKSHDSQNSSYVDAPFIQVRSEFPTIIQTTDPTQPLTCIVAIELLGKSSRLCTCPLVSRNLPCCQAHHVGLSNIKRPRLSPPQYATTTSLQPEETEPYLRECLNDKNWSDAPIAAEPKKLVINIDATEE